MRCLSPAEPRIRDGLPAPPSGGTGRWASRLKTILVIGAFLTAAPWAGIEAEAAGARSSGAASRTSLGAPPGAIAPARTRSRGNAAEARRQQPSPRVTREARGRAAPRQAAPRHGGVRAAAAAPRRGRAGAAPAPVAAPATLPSVSPEVLHALQSVAASPSERVLLFALASRESRFVATARNPASSARGLMQFTRTTWLEAVRDHGPAHGLAFHADALSTDPETGTISARDSRLLEELLVLRDDPNLSAAFAMARLGLEKENLAPVLRRPVTDADLYLVHFLGPVGARRFLRELARAPSQRASDIVGADAVAANRNVFVARNGRHRSLGQVHAAVRQDLRRQRAVYAGLMGGAGPGRAEVAEAR